MIYVNKNTTNTLVLTLTEKSQIQAPSYLFKFVDDSTKTEKLFNMADTSPYARRYNLFQLTETPNENLSAGQVELNYGFGRYKVYESVNPTLFISGTTGRVLEEGIYFVPSYPASMNNNNSNTIYI
jgi:hypothetical protein